MTLQDPTHDQERKAAAEAARQKRKHLATYGDTLTPELREREMAKVVELERKAGLVPAAAE